MKRKEITSKELEEFLKDKRLKLDCGHHASPKHNLSNTIVIYSHGSVIETK